MSPRTSLLLVAVVLAMRAPFLWTRHVQEDAYISFRTGFNLADHGQLTFNLGERYAASTSISYAYIIAAIRWLASAQAVPVILAVDALVAAVAVVQMARVFQTSGRRSAWFVAALALSAGALQPAYNGMETAWCLSYVGLLAQAVGAASIAPGWFAALLVVGPLLRPDIALFSFGAWALRAGARRPQDRRGLAWGALGLAAGAVLFFALNQLHSGMWWPPSMVAKRAAYPASMEPTMIARRVFEVYFEGPLSLLPSSKLIPRWLSVLASCLTLGALVTSLARARRRLPADELLAFFFMGWGALLFPLGFAIAGVTFPWYFHPAAFALAACLCVAIERGLLRPRPALSAVALGSSLAAASVQLLLSLNVGRQESGYRAGVGEYLAQVSLPGDTLVLEPAGYIPYHSGLVTFDEVGLVSPRVLPYLASTGRWLGRFLRAVCPTFTVQRTPFPPPGGPGAAPWTPSEAWFGASYELLRHFQYRPQDWARSPLELSVLRYGSHADYIVYRRRSTSVCDIE